MSATPKQRKLRRRAPSLEGRPSRHSRNRSRESQRRSSESRLRPAYQSLERGPQYEPQTEQHQQATADETAQMIPSYVQEFQQEAMEFQHIQFSKEQRAQIWQDAKEMQARMKIRRWSTPPSWERKARQAASDFWSNYWKECEAKSETERLRRQASRLSFDMSASQLLFEAAHYGYEDDGEMNEDEGGEGGEGGEAALAYAQAVEAADNTEVPTWWQEQATASPSFDLSRPGAFADVQGTYEAAVRSQITSGASSSARFATTSRPNTARPQGRRRSSALATSSPTRPTSARSSRQRSRRRPGSAGDMMASISRTTFDAKLGKIGFNEMREAEQRLKFAEEAQKAEKLLAKSSDLGLQSAKRQNRSQRSRRKGSSSSVPAPDQLAKRKPEHDETNKRSEATVGVPQSGSGDPPQSPTPTARAPRTPAPRAAESTAAPTTATSRSSGPGRQAGGAKARREDMVRQGSLLIPKKAFESQMAAMREANVGMPQHVGTRAPADADNADEDRFRAAVEKELLVRPADARHKGAAGPKPSFDGVFGLDDAKQALQEAIVFPNLIPEFFTSDIRRPWKGVLLFGPPGTGKTLLARSVAAMGSVSFFNASAATLCSKYRGDSEKMVRALFDVAREKAPSLVFLDEVDALIGSRGDTTGDEASRRVKTEVLKQMDGIESAVDAERNKRVMVMAASNAPWDLDEAFVRRLEKRIYIPPPDASTRKSILSALLKSVPAAFERETSDGNSSLFPDPSSVGPYMVGWQKIDLQNLAQRTKGYSGADLRAVAREAAMTPVRRLLEGCSSEEIKAMKDKGGLQVKPVTGVDCELALTRTRPTITPEQVKRFEQWACEFGASTTLFDDAYPNSAY